MEHITRVFSTMGNFELVSAVTAFLLLLFIRYFLVRTVYNIEFKSLERRSRWLSFTRTVTFIFIVIVFILMWGEELRSLAISLAAVAVALVLALKEVILCIMGGIVKASYNLFEIGDRITIGKIRGEVIDHNLYQTTLFEVGPGPTSNQYTGKQVKIPNSLFLTDSFFITPSGNHYTLHVMVVKSTLDKNIFEKQKVLLEAAQAVSAPYATLAEEYISNMCKKQGVKTPELKPRVLYETTSSTEVEFHVRMPMPFSALARTENKVKDMFLSEVFKRNL